MIFFKMYRALYIILASIIQENGVCSKIKMSAYIFKIYLKVKLLRSKKVKIFGQTVYTGNTKYFLYSFLEIFLLKTYQPRYLMDQKFIIDIGSNCGLFAIYCSLLFPKAKIICFEPEGFAHRVLCQNVGNNPNITLHDVALSDKRKQVCLYYSLQSPGSPYSSIHYSTDKTPDRIAIESCKLSDYLNEKREIDLMKIDAEGAEESILEDLEKNDILKHIKEIFIEVHNPTLLNNIKSILRRNKLAFIIKSTINQKLDDNIIIHCYNGKMND